MIEPQSEQPGASAWVWKLTFVAPRFRVIVEVAASAVAVAGLAEPPFAAAAEGVAVGRDDRQFLVRGRRRATAVALGFSGSTAWAGAGSGATAGAGAATLRPGRRDGLDRG